MNKDLLTSAMFLVGLAAIVSGAWLIAMPVGLIVLGVFLAVGGALLDARPSGRAPVAGEGND